MLSSLGINMDSFKIVYSIFTEKNGQFITNVLLMDNTIRGIPSIICLHLNINNRRKFKIINKKKL
jgi:hypothetical protein